MPQDINDHIFWSAYVRGSWIVFCDIFSKFFSGLYFWKNLLACLVISSGNFHLLSSALEMILTFLWITESSSLLSNSEEDLDDWHGEGDFFVFFPYFFNFFSPPPIYGISTTSGLGWTVSTEFIIVLLLDGFCKSIFLSAILSSVSVSVFYIGSSVNEIINWPSLIIIFFLVMFLTWLTCFFTIWNNTTITHDVCTKWEKLSENWMQGLNSVISVQVADIQY